MSILHPIPSLFAQLLHPSHPTSCLLPVPQHWQPRVPPDWDPPASWDSICASHAVLGQLPCPSLQVAAPASRPPCAPCSQHAGPRSGTSAPGSSSSLSCSGCSAFCCWVSRGLWGVPVGWAHTRSHPSPAPTGTVSLLILIYLVFTSFWPISALYLAWIIFDWDTPEKGGDGQSPPFLQLCSRMGCRVSFSLGPSWHSKWGAPCPTCSFFLFPHHHHGGKRDMAGPRGVFPAGPAAMRHLWCLPILQVAGGCRACGDGLCGGTFGIISP